jgi:hypothetical protein
MAGTSAAATATGSANQSSSTVQNAQTIASNAYGNNLNAYSRLGAADIQASATAGAGLGSLAGTILGTGTGGDGTLLGDIAGAAGI